MDKELWTLKEIAEEVDKLIKFTLEMQAVTRYKNDGKFKMQKLSLWTYEILKKKASERNDFTK